MSEYLSFLTPINISIDTRPFFNSGPEHIAIQSNSGAATPKQEGHLQISGFMVSGLITKMEATHPTAIPTALSTEPR